MNDIAKKIELALENYKHGDWGEEFTRKRIDECVNEIKDRAETVIENRKKQKIKYDFIKL